MGIREQLLTPVDSPERKQRPLLVKWLLLQLLTLSLSLSLPLSEQQLSALGLQVQQLQQALAEERLKNERMCQLLLQSQSRQTADEEVCWNRR